MVCRCDSLNVNPVTFKVSIKITRLYLAVMLYCFMYLPLLYVVPPLSPSVSMNINCICHYRGTDTAGVFALHSLHTSKQTLSQVLVCLRRHLNTHISHVPHICTQTHTHTFHPTYKPQSASPHSAHVFSPSLSSVFPAPTFLPALN